MSANSSIIYFLTRSLFLGFGISLLFLVSGKDAYLGAILGTLFGLIITYSYNYILTNKNGNLKYLYNNHKYLGLIARITMGIASYLIIIYSLILYSTFTISFLLTSTPNLYILIPMVILALYCAFKGLKIITRVANSLLPISIILSILPIIGLVVYFDATNFLPILTTSPLSFFKTALIYAGISSFPNILTLHFNNNIKNNYKVYIIASILIILTIICINGVFGEYLTNIYRFPEYMVLKQLKLFKFIEKVENIFSLTWVIDIFITLTMGIYSLKETLPYKYNKQVTIGILIITIFMIDKIFGFNYVVELFMYYALPYIALSVSIIILIIFRILIRKQIKNKNL